MKTYKTSELQDELSERLAATEISPGRTFAGQWWGRGDLAERFYFGDSATIKKNGKKQRTRVWLQFDDPATLEGCSLRVEAKKAWHKNTLAQWHAKAFAIALEIGDPVNAAKFREECARAEVVGDLTGGED